ncbi:MAG: hypothetical protein IJC81_05320 [Clostridia bacterium]|nr:hypothetical protein [Clostridia bacterium]
MKNLKSKFTSRKFLVAASGVVSGIVLIASGNATEGASAIVASVLGYLIAEGYIDAKAVKAAADKAKEE